MELKALKLLSFKNSKKCSYKNKIQHLLSPRTTKNLSNL